MRLLDLYCGAGGASMGYHRAGFEVIGIDISDQPRYPFTFKQADALDMLADRDFLMGFDAIHASPPCQSETMLRHRTGKTYEDLLTPTLDALAGYPRPWVVENVEPTDKMPGSIILCGTEFGLNCDGRWLKRHRRFSSSVALRRFGACLCRVVPIGGVYGNGGGGPMTRGYKFTRAQGSVAMGIDWMTRAELGQAVPPAYTYWVGKQINENGCN